MFEYRNACWADSFVIGLYQMSSFRTICCFAQTVSDYIRVKHTTCLWLELRMVEAILFIIAKQTISLHSVPVRVWKIGPIFIAFNLNQKYYSFLECDLFKRPFIFF